MMSNGMMSRIRGKRFAEEPKHRSALRKGLIPSLFFLSLALNFYFLFLQGDRVNPPEPVLEHAKGEEDAPARVEEKATPKISAWDSGGEEYREVEVPALGKRRVRHLSFSIQSSLSQTLCKTLSREGGCEFLSAYVGRLVAWKLNPYSDLRKGDRLSLLLEGPIDRDHNNIVALRFQGSKVKNLKIFYYQSATWTPGSYFDEDGREIFPRFPEQEAPIRDFTEITSWVGDYRPNGEIHSGVDFKAPVGTPVFATFPGKVTRVNWNFRNNGDCIEIDHPREGIKSLYLHLNKVEVKVGEAVKQGRKIGESGNTGHSFAPHLHYELRDRDHKEKIYDPFTLKFHHSFHENIPPGERDAFMRHVDEYRRLLNG